MNSKHLKGIDSNKFFAGRCFMPYCILLVTKDALATSLLSTRLKHLSTLITNIDVSDYEFGSSRFYSYSSAWANGYFLATGLCNLWVWCLRRARYQIIFAVYPSSVFAAGSHMFSTFLISEYSLYSYLMFVKWISRWNLKSTIHSLVKYVIANLQIFWKLGSRFCLNVPRLVVLLNLKALDLQSIDLINEASISRLLSRCPMLEDLNFFLCHFTASDSIEIAHPLLEKLKLNCTPI